MIEFILGFFTGAGIIIAIGFYIDYKDKKKNKGFWVNSGKFDRESLR